MLLVPLYREEPPLYPQVGLYCHKGYECLVRLVGVGPTFESILR